MEGGRKGGRDRREIERDWGIGVVSGSVCARKRECREREREREVGSVSES
jgi:hypothetical protein